MTKDNKKANNRRIKLDLTITENDNKDNDRAIFINAIIAIKGLSLKFKIVSLAIIASGMKYKPIPKLIEVNDTFSQFSETMPEAINTAPQTGGVIVDNNANQKIKRWTCKSSNPISTKAGPATETHIT